MNLFLKNKSNANPLLTETFSWLKLVGVTGGAQVIIQAIGFVSGILVIRTLSTQEYALYTLANTLLGTLVILANSGISVGVTAQGGKVWKDRVKLGEVLVTGFDLKKKFTIFSLILGTPILIYLLIKNEASWLMTILIVISLIPAFVSSVSNALLEIAPKLQQDIIPLQKNQLAINFGRLLLLGLLIFIFPFAFIAILASGLPQIWGNFRLRKIAKKHVDFNQQLSPIVRKDIIATVKRILPNAIYYSISGQITIWLLSVFGSTTSVAQIGALGRIAIVLNLIGIIFGTLITPRFSRLAENFKILLNRFFIAHIILFLIFSFIVLLVSIFTKEVLWVLGSKYAHLENELILTLVASSINYFAGCIYGLYSNRGWIINPIITISLSIIVLIIAILINDVSTLKGVLYLNIIVATFQLLTHSFYGFLRIFKLKGIKTQ